MRRLPFQTAIAIVLASVSLTGQASAEIVFEARQWSPDLSGEIRIDGSSVIETIDLTNDLGLQDDESIEGRLTIRPSRRTLVRLGWTPLTMNGDKIISRTISFLGRDFEISSRVESELELEYARVGFAWQFFSSGDGKYRIGPLVEAKGFRGKATLSAPDLPVPARESEEFETAFASVGLILDLEPSERFHIFAEGSVLVDDSQGELTETEIGVRFFPAKYVSIVAGLRQLEIDAEDEDDLLKMDLDGVFGGISIHF